MPQSFTCLHCHEVFRTKNRSACITPDLAPRLYKYTGGILRAADGALVAAGGMPDHVHLLCSLGKQMSVSDALRLIKTDSSKWIHETFPGNRDFAWQTGYAAFAVSLSNLPTVKAYIVNQREHHRTTTFQEEFVAFLRRHDIKFDERYLWD